MNVTFGFVDEPPCVNIWATPVGLALYAARNASLSKEKLPSLSAEMPMRSGLTRPLPLTASSSALARLLASCRADQVAGECLRGVRGGVVRGQPTRSSCAACWRRRPVPAPCRRGRLASREVETVTGPVVVPCSVSVTPDEQSRHDVRARGDRECAGSGTDRELRVRGRVHRDETARARAELGARQR